MTCTLYRVASSEIEALKNDSVRVREIVNGRGEDWIVTRPKGLIGFLLRFTPISVETVTAREPLTAEGPQAIREMECDLEGSWQGLHFLFTGTAWDGDEPACYLIRGGEAVGDDEFEDPPRLLRPELTSGFSRFLSSLSEDELRRRYEPQRMAELKVDATSLALLLSSFHELSQFAEKAASAGDGLLIHLG